MAQGFNQNMQDSIKKSVSSTIDAVSKYQFGKTTRPRYNQHNSINEHKNHEHEHKNHEHEPKNTAEKHAGQVVSHDAGGQVVSHDAGQVVSRDGRGSHINRAAEVVGANTIRGVEDIQSRLFDYATRYGYNVLKGSSLNNVVGVLSDSLSKGFVRDTPGPDRRTNVMGRVNLLLEGNEEKKHNVNNIENTVGDLDGDGDVDKKDVAISQSGMDLVNELRILHPLIARAHRDPNFMQRTIKRRAIHNERTHKQTDQVHLVQQGIAGHVEDVNMFQVNF